MPAFPIAKLVGIVVKQMGKPLANFAKERAKNNHFFRTYICMPPAQCKYTNMKPQTIYYACAISTVWYK